MTRSFHSARPFSTPTSEIAAALEEVSIPTLLLSMVHLTGDPSFVRDFAQAGLFLNEIQGFMSEEDKARLWPRLTASWPAYDSYQRKTERPIPVIRLTPR